MFYKYQKVYNKKLGESQLKKVYPFWAQLLITFLVAVVAAVGARALLFEPFYVPSGSMRNTFIEDDKIIVQKLSPTPFALQRGDIVVFVDPGGWLPPDPETPIDTPFNRFLNFIGFLPAPGEQFLVKRLIGLPGDRVTCEGSGQAVKINGVPIIEPYVADGQSPSDIQFDITVPSGSLWVMGDNRGNSADSRYNTANPFVPISNVKGTVFLTFYPMEHFKFPSMYHEVFDDVPAPE